MLLVFYISYDNRDYYLKGRNNDDDSICDDVFDNHEWIMIIMSGLCKLIIDFSMIKIV